MEHVADQEKLRIFAYNDSNFDLCFHISSHVLLPEMFELQNFPFDSQDLTIKLSLHLPYPRGKIMINETSASSFAQESFRFKSEFDITYGRQVHCKELCSNPQVSAVGAIYTRITCKLNLTRRPQFCMTNIVMPMAVLTALTSISIGVRSNDGSRMDTADRLSVTLTLLLTAVAFKLVMASSLPQVSYQTTLDVYILICNFWILLAAVENVLYPSFGYLDRGDDVHKAKERFNEWYLTLLYLASFVLINIVFWWRVNVDVKKRNAVIKTKYEREEVEREKHCVAPPAHVMSTLLQTSTPEVADESKGFSDENAQPKKRYTKVAHGFGNRTAKARARRRSTLQGNQVAPPMPTITGEATSARSPSVRLAPIPAASTPI